METHQYPTEAQLRRFEAETDAATEDMKMGPWCPAPDETDDDGTTHCAVYVWDTCIEGPPDTDALKTST